MAIGPLTLGPNPPDVTTPMRSPDDDSTSVPSRAGARPSGLMPTRLRLGAWASSSWMRLAPGKPPSLRRRFWIDQPSPASIGLVVSSMSCP